MVDVLRLFGDLNKRNFYKKCGSLALAWPCKADGNERIFFNKKTVLGRCNDKFGLLWTPWMKLWIWVWEDKWLAVKGFEKFPSTGRGDSCNLHNVHFTSIVHFQCSEIYISNVQNKKKHFQSSEKNIPMFRKTFPMSRGIHLKCSEKKISIVQRRTFPTFRKNISNVQRRTFPILPGPQWTILFFRVYRAQSS